MVSTSRTPRPASAPSSFMFTLAKYIITAVRKTITSMEPVSPSARMMATGRSTVSMIRRKERTLDMG